MAEDFVKVECGECGNKQNIYSRASTEVECLVCRETIARPTGGKAEINGQILQELEVE
ncbi:MAG: 30S ribosomal protein S27e [Candidatus Nanohaloarchaea archaeon]